MRKYARAEEEWKWCGGEEEDVRKEERKRERKEGEREERAVIKERREEKRRNMGKEKGYSVIKLWRRDKGWKEMQNVRRER